jgi:hypothetical protein
MSVKIVYFVSDIMKKINNILLIILFAVTIFVTGCSSSKKSGCGCPSKKGLVGY